MSYPRLSNLPVIFTFLGSLLLSALAFLNVTLNRDGMLYAEAARVFVADGFDAAIRIFPWPFLSIVMGTLSAFTGFSPENCGYVLNAFFMAGCCALLIDIIGRYECDKAIIWLSAITVLTIPGLNDYRGELLREYGSWFFTLFAFHVALGWPNNPSWIRVLCLPLLFAIAALFRPETIVYYLGVLLWIGTCETQLNHGDKKLRLVMPPLLLGLLGLFIGYLAWDTQNRSLPLTELIRKLDFFSQFDQTAQKVGAVFNDYARYSAQSAHVILFFGSLALIPWKLLAKFGPFLIPLAAFLRLPNFREILHRHQLFAWGILIHGLILSMFVLQQQFVSGRYLAPLLLFSVPFLAHGLHQLLVTYPRWKKYTFIACAVLAVSNVISLKPTKAHFREAGHWLAANYKENPRIYVESARAAHYAGWHYLKYALPKERQQLSNEISGGHYDLLVLESSAKAGDITGWLQENHLIETKRFVDGEGNAVIIAKPAPEKNSQ